MPELPKLPPGFQLTAFVFTNHTAALNEESEGLLPLDTRAQAAWYYCRLATMHLRDVDEGAVYEGERDNAESLQNIMLACATLYSIEDPTEIEKFIPICKAEVYRIGGEWDIRIERPFLGTYVRVAN